MQSIATGLLIFCYELAKMRHECARQCLGSQSRGGLWVILSERRKYSRLVTGFKVAFTRSDEIWEIEAVTHDISQTGSFIHTPHWLTFAQGVRTNLRFFLPPDFTEQPGTLILQGPGVVPRLDAERSGIGIEFLWPLRTFNPTRNVRE